MTVDESTTEADTQAGAAVAHIEARYSIARDAITNDRKHAEDALRQFLQAAGRDLAGFRIDSAAEPPLDDTILNALAAMKPCRDYFLELVHLSCLHHSGSHALHEHFRAFLGQSIALKQAPRDIIHFNHLWCDHYRFFVRELFLCTIALLLRHEKTDEAAAYLTSVYRYPSQQGEQKCNFLKFDAYIKSLDEFRARRLRHQRQSIASDVLKERADLAYLSFDEIMQADFLLCVYGLLHYPEALTRWCPRTVVYAQGFEKNGFDIFFKAQSAQHFDKLAKVLDVRNKNDLLERFERSRAQCRLDQWKFGGCPIPFASYMGLQALSGA